MKKRILTFMLACMTMLSLVACGGNETETETNDNVTADTVVTEDAPMDAPDWTDMVITVNALDAIGRPSAESYALKETAFNDMLSERLCDDYNTIPTHVDIHNNEMATITCSPHTGVGANPYATISATCFRNETTSTHSPMVSGVKVVLDPTIKKQIADWKELLLPAGITCGSTIAEVEAVYGTPTSTDVTAEGCTVYRYDDADKHLVLEFDANSTVVVFEYYYDLNGYTEVE